MTTTTKRWREAADAAGAQPRPGAKIAAVHAAGALGVDYTLCGLALEGERGDTPMVLTSDLIQCRDCEGIILYCKMIKPAEINQISRRWIEARRTRRA